MTNTLRIAILDMNAGEPNEGMRCIKMLVAQFLAREEVQGSYDVFDVRSRNELPECGPYDIFICSGGPGSPEPQGEAWERPFFRLLDTLVSHNTASPQKKFLFLICHSFQLACQHWKVAKLGRRKSMAFGIMPVHKTAEGKDEPLLKGLSDPFYAVDSRDYQVIKPDKNQLGILGAKLLCMEKIRPHIDLERAVMAIRFSDEIFGVQFHPEADSVGMRMYFLRNDKMEHIIKHHGKQKYKDMLDHLEDDDKILRTNRTIIPRFLLQAADALDNSKLVTV